MQGGSRQLGVTERMLAGQRLNSQRLKSQELPEYEPSEETADDEEAPQGRRPAGVARLPDMPMQRSASLASRAHSADSLPHHMGTKSARRYCSACFLFADVHMLSVLPSCLYLNLWDAVGSVAAA